MNFENDIKECLRVLEKGGLILYPTDTVWGIGCDATNEKAVEKIFSLKQRPDTKSMIVLVTGVEEIHRYVTHPDKRIFEHLATLKKPTTVIYEGARGLAKNLIGYDGSIAIRIVSDDFCEKLIMEFQKPLVSTSANISGQPSGRSFRDIRDTIKNGVDYIVQHRQNDIINTQPSAIIKFNNGKIDALRP